jgi:hypothetical protein
MVKLAPDSRPSTPTPRLLATQAAADLLTGSVPGNELSAALETPLVAVDVDDLTVSDLASLAGLRNAPCVTVAVSLHDPPTIPAADLPFDILLTDGDPPYGWVRPAAGASAALQLISGLTASQSTAATALVQLLRMASRLGVSDALVAESLCYSLLLAGRGFAEWLEHTKRPEPRRQAAPAVEVARRGTLLEITLNRPDVRNAFNVEMRDLLANAISLAQLDSAIERVTLCGRGESFCSGGDLSEFGTSEDPASAHLVRTTRSPGLLLAQCSAKVTAFVHGACVGAGTELAAFAGCVVARPDTTFLLPELTMGLIPGAGGTVSLARRVGRQRAAYLALSAQPIGASLAAEWGLVDEIR